MDRVFLDANVLFSASYRENSGLLPLWQLPDAELITSIYASEEARRNIDDPSQLDRFDQLDLKITMPIWFQDQLPDGISIAEKDRPILLDAINSGATHLLTGDKQHFGPLYGQTIGGVLILPPAEYLAMRPGIGKTDPGDLHG